MCEALGQHRSARAIEGTRWRTSHLPRLHPALIVVVGACAALFHRSDADRSFGRRVLPVGRRPMDACPSLGDPTRRVLLHGCRSPVARRRMGFRGTSCLVGEAHRRRFLLACLGRGLRGRSAGRRGRGGGSRARVGYGQPRCRCLAAAGLSVGRGRSPPGPQLFLLCLVLLLLTLGRRRHAWLFAVPALLLVWANVHGSFLLGLGVLGLEVVWSFLPPVRGRLAISRPLPRKLAGLTFASASWRPWSTLMGRRYSATP